MDLFVCFHEMGMKQPQDTQILSIQLRNVVSPMQMPSQWMQRYEPMGEQIQNIYGFRKCMPFVVFFFFLILSFVGMSKFFCFLICIFLDEVQVIPMLMLFLWFQVVAIDRKNGYKLMSFQELSSRGRGSKDASITLDSIKVISCGFFDNLASDILRICVCSSIFSWKGCCKEYQNEHIVYMKLTEK